MVTDNRIILDRAQLHAEYASTCCKVKVASVIVTSDLEVVYGTNRGVDYTCSVDGCLRIKTYGEASKLHRLPSDCAAIHSEVDAICQAAREGLQLEGAKIFVTRYPCEACARAIVVAGIKEVVYGRQQEISEMTRDIFNKNGVKVTHCADWDREDSTI